MCCLPRMPSACGCIAGEHEDRSMLLVAFSRRMSWVSQERRRGGRLPGVGGSARLAKSPPSHWGEDVIYIGRIRKHRPRFRPPAHLPRAT